MIKGESDEDNLQQGCWQKLLFFVRHAWRDLQRHKCHFCLAFCSVFIVVLATLMVTTIVAQGPLIFVNLVQVDTGEMDVFYVAQNRCWDNYSASFAHCPVQMNQYVDEARGFNLTQIWELYGDEFNFAPRMHIQTKTATKEDVQIYFID